MAMPVVQAVPVAVPVALALLLAVLGRVDKGIVAGQPRVTITLVVLVVGLAQLVDTWLPTQLAQLAAQGWRLPYPEVQSFMLAAAASAHTQLDLAAQAAMAVVVLGATSHQTETQARQTLVVVVAVVQAMVSTQAVQEAPASSSSAM